jgi:hypothetical protein
MTKYKCNKCAKIYEHKNDYNRHINRKTTCNLEYVCQNNLNKTGNETAPVKIKEKKVHKCKYCNDEFTRASSLIRHLDTRCSTRKQIEDNPLLNTMIKNMDDMKKEFDEKINILKHENNILIKKIDENKGNITNTTNIDKQVNIDKQQINNKNNIKLIAFGEEDLSVISDQVCKQLLKRGFKSVQYMLEHVHFNKDNPENQNVYIPNLNNDYVTIFNGDDWSTKIKDDIIDQLIDNSNGYLGEKFNKFIKDNSLDEATIKKYQRYLDEQDDDSVKKTQKKEIKLLLYNNRKLPMEIKKTIEANKKNKLIDN